MKSKVEYLCRVSKSSNSNMGVAAVGAKSLECYSCEHHLWALLGYIGGKVKL